MLGGLAAAARVLAHLIRFGAVQHSQLRVAAHRA